MNKNLFKPTSSTPAADTTNSAGHKAYSMTDKHLLAQLCTSGFMNDTYYVNAESQLDQIKKLAQKVPAKYVAQLALYARKEGFMKDTPAVLCAILASRDVQLLKAIFPKVIDNGKMLRNFVTAIRSGTAGRKSFGTSVKKTIQRWFDSRKDETIFRESVGADGASIADVIRLTHPSPANTAREALYAYIIGKKVVNIKADMEKDKNGRNTTVLFGDLPECVQAYENYKNAIINKSKHVPEVPNVEFRLLTNLSLGTDEWTKIAKDMPWTATRMNLNTFARHGVFNDSKMVKTVADRLADRELILKSKAFPYQIMNAYLNVGNDIPTKVKDALQDALEVATENVPKFNVNGGHVLVDTSGSMGSIVTGNRGSATSNVKYVDVAGLVASCVVRQNKDFNVVLFDTSAYNESFNSRDSVMTNARKFAKNGGGTDCSCALKKLNSDRATGDLVIFVSDNESNSQISFNSRMRSNGTSAMDEWKSYKKRNPKAKLVCIDIAPYTTTQHANDKDILHVSGFSDNVFSIIAEWVEGKLNGDYFVTTIENVEIPEVVSSVVAVAKAGVSKAANKQKRDSSGRFK